MVNRALSFEYGFQDTSGRNQRKTNRRWGKGKPAAQRMRECRSRKRPAERAITSAICYARRRLAACHILPKSSAKQRKFKVGQQVLYLCIGKQGPLYKGKVLQLWESPSPSKYGNFFIIIARDRRDRQYDSRLSKCVAVPPANVFPLL